MAQMMTRITSWSPKADLVTIEPASLRVRVIELDDKYAIRKPISPRATIAIEMMGAGIGRVPWNTSSRLEQWLGTASDTYG